MPRPTDPSPSSGAPPGPGVADDTAHQPGRPAPRPRHRFGVLLWLCALVIVADQAVKAGIQAKLAPFESWTVVPGVLEIVHVRNTGVAFGFLNESSMDDGLKMVVTTALAALALFGIALYARHVPPHEKLARVGLSLILCGALGNLIDRLRLGYVIDYVDVYWEAWHFWAFNIADASITIGAGLVFLELLLVNRHASHPL